VIEGFGGFERDVERFAEWDKREIVFRVGEGFADL